jgi:hypothetical protein
MGIHKDAVLLKATLVFGLPGRSFLSEFALLDLTSIIAVFG